MEQRPPSSPPNEDTIEGSEMEERSPPTSPPPSFPMVIDSSSADETTQGSEIEENPPPPSTAPSMVMVVSSATDDTIQRSEMETSTPPPPPPSPRSWPAPPSPVPPKRRSEERISDRLYALRDPASFARCCFEVTGSLQVVEKIQKRKKDRGSQPPPAPQPPHLPSTIPNAEALTSSSTSETQMAQVSQSLGLSQPLSHQAGNTIGGSFVPPPLLPPPPFTSFNPESLPSPSATQLAELSKLVESLPSSLKDRSPTIGGSDAPPPLLPFLLTPTNSNAESLPALSASQLAELSKLVGELPSPGSQMSSMKQSSAPSKAPTTFLRVKKKPDTLRLAPPSERELMQAKKFKLPARPWPPPPRPSSSSVPPFEYDVFLSFQIVTCRNFVDHLYDAFVERGIRTFRKEEVPEDEADVGQLMKTIRKSEMFVPIISESYCASKLCLREIAKMVACNRVILPIFYHVDPHDVRNQKGPFRVPFQKHMEGLRKAKRVDEKMFKEWKAALREVGSISGLEIRDGDEAELIQVITKRVLSELKSCPVDVVKHPIGIHSHVERVLDLLDVGNGGLKFVGICGKEGIGKTTLAMAAYDRIYYKFDCRSFILGVGDIIETKGVMALRDQLNFDISATDTRDSMCLETTWVRNRKALIVLDGVTNPTHLDGFAKHKNRFHPGTRIIVTAPDGKVLEGLDDHEIYQMKELDPEQSFQLFIWHAFRRDFFEDKYLALSRKFVSATQGLPLAIEVAGAFLFGKREIEDWETTLTRMESIPPVDIHRWLKVIFDSLSDDEKSIFLDVACIMEGMNSEAGIHVWKNCAFASMGSVTTLLHKSLLKINSSCVLQLHELLRETGRCIVREESDEIGKRSRLWIREEILSLFYYRMELRKVEGIKLGVDLDMHERHHDGDDIGEEGDTSENDDDDDDDCISVRCESFASEEKLRLLSISNTRLIGEHANLPKKLKLFQWQWCPLESLPNDLILEEVAHLDLSHSMLVQMWRDEQTKSFDRLKVLDLKSCKHLTAPDFSAFPGLVTIILDDCRSLVELPESVSNLKNLSFLSMKNCTKLNNLPGSITQLVSLKKLQLDDCICLETLPDSIHMLGSIETLSLRSCKAMKRLPESLFESSSLRVLDLAGCCNLERLPDDASRTVSLETADLRGCSKITTLPVCISDSTSLKILRLDSCLAMHGGQAYNDNAQVISLRMLGLIQLDGSITANGLRHLDLSYCLFLTSIPDWLVAMGTLEVLIISGIRIKELPGNLESLVNLRVLDASDCANLSCLPDSIGELRSLSEISLRGTPLSMLPDSMEDLKKLRKLDLRSCTEIKELPASLCIMENGIEILIDEGNSQQLHNFLSIFRPDDFGTEREPKRPKLGGEEEEEDEEEEVQLAEGSNSEMLEWWIPLIESPHDLELMAEIRHGTSIMTVAFRVLRYIQTQMVKRDDKEWSVTLITVKKIFSNAFLNQLKEDLSHFCKSRDASASGFKAVDAHIVLRRLVEGYLTPAFLTKFRSNLTDKDFPLNVLQHMENHYKASQYHAFQSYELPQTKEPDIHWVIAISFIFLIGVMNGIPRSLFEDVVLRKIRDSELRSCTPFPEESSSAENTSSEMHKAVLVKSIQAIAYVLLHLRDRLVSRGR